MQYKLAEIFDLQMGKTPDRHNPDYWDEGTEPWISIADMTKSGKYIRETDECITEKGAEESGIKKIPKNTVIMSFKLSIGKVAITPDPIYSNEAIMAFIDKGVVKIDPVYLYYLLMHRNWDAGTNKAVMGKTLNKATLSDTTVNINAYTKQESVVEVLDKASQVIEAKKAELDELDTFIKARFVEMFGDPLKNTMNWDQKCITDICNNIYGGGTPSKSHPEYFEGNIPWVSPKDMKSDMIYDSQDHITEEAVENSSAKLVPSGAVLMVIRSGILKHSLPVAIAMVDVTVNQDMKAFITNDDISSEYLMYYFKAIENDVLSGVRGVTADNIDFKDFQKRMVIVPPIDKQKDFSDFVAQVDKSKVVVQKSLDETQLLFNSLMQKYFG